MPTCAPAALVLITARRVQTLELVDGPCDDALPIFCHRPHGPVFIGEGPINYLCARCSAIVCEGIAPGDLAGIAVRCRCGAVSRLPGTAPRSATR